MEIKITKRDKEIIQKYKTLFSLTARAFYGDLEIVTMDAFLNLYFSQFIVETDQITNHTQLPEEKIRQALYLFGKADILKEVTLRQLNNQPELQELVKQRWEEESLKKCEFWALNHDIWWVLNRRLLTIEKKIDNDFKNFDNFTKKCTNSYCRKEFRTEEYFGLNDKCSTCGNALDYKYKMEQDSQKKVEDKDKAIELIQYFHNYLKGLENMRFPDLTSVRQNYREVFGEEEKKDEENGDGQNKANNSDDSDINDKLIDTLDYNLRFVKLPNNFFKTDIRMEEGGKFDRTLRNIGKETLMYFREADLKRVIVSEEEEKLIRQEEILRKRDAIDRLGAVEKRKYYIDKMKKLKFI